MKRNTTPTVDVKVPVPLDSVKSIEFIFKEECGESYPTLIRKKFVREQIPVKDRQETNCFTVLLSFSASETMKLPEGEIYMDTRIVLNGDLIPPTKICCIDIKKTLFDDIFDGSDSNTAGGE